MAKEKEVAAEEAVEQPKGKGKKKLIIIAAAVLVLVLVGGGAAFLLLSKPADKHAKQAETAAEEDKNPPVYESLDSFTVNLAGGESYLAVEIKLLVASTDFDEKLKERMPEVRNDILNLLSSKQPDELSTPEGKAKLAADIQTDINGLLKVKPEKGVKKVLFGSFLIQ
jgi:flagellar FliL protein